MKQSLVQKYNIPGPRYTSYPTVPYWNKEGISRADWQETLVRSFAESNSTEGISLYIHLPYCESLCTFCGCHKRITKQHSVEKPYIEYVLKEWKLYTDLLPETPIIKEIHFGGGTPTFFKPENLKILVEGIFKLAIQAEEVEFSLEGHPNNTTEAHMQVLYDIGFKRISFGVQDYDPKVQKAINRIQPKEKVAYVTDKAREIGYTSISHDLIYGLPHQTLDSIKETIEHTKTFKPDRIAFYSYAHVPWIKGNGQRGFKDSDLPKDDEKRELYEEGKKMLAELGYYEIGMDHFALKSDSLYKSLFDGNIHRNFMGYSSSKTQVMIGLGVSSISDSWYSFAQNAKTIEEYYELLDQDLIPIFRGHKLTEEDLVIRRHILNMMCTLETDWSDPALQFPELDSTLESLQEMVSDGLLQIDGTKLTVTEKGRPFVRNICMAFDLRLLRDKPTTRIFSMTI